MTDPESPPPGDERRDSKLERAFELVLWKSRYVALVAVIGSLLVSFVMFFVASVDVVDLVVHLGHYGSQPEARAELRATLVTHVVEVVDGYLLAAIMLIFSLGIYELFVSRIDAAEGSEFASRLLLIRNLDDLKDRLAKVVLLILVVKFFEYALSLKFDSPRALLELAVGIALVSAGLWLSHSRKH